MKHFEAELPEGYVQAKVVDAKSKKVAIAFNVISLIIMAAIFVLLWLIVFGTQPIDGVVKQLVVTEWWQTLARFAVFIAAYVAYVVLHEVTHGIAYKALTKQKLTFGMTLSVAYCGVPNIYVYRTCALVALLAPFVVFDIVFVFPIIFITDVAFKLIFMAMFAMHVGGCVGDLYDTALYAFVFRDKTVLMRDTGPKQTFYVLRASKLGQKILQNENATKEEGSSISADAENSVSEE